MSVYTSGFRGVGLAQPHSMMTTRHSLAEMGGKSYQPARSYRYPSYGRPQKANASRTSKNSRVTGQAPFSIMARQATWALIGLNTAVFSAWKYGEYARNIKLIRQLQANTTLSLIGLQLGRWWTLITCAFSHNSGGHFLFNMIAFFNFASIISWAPGFGAFRVVSLYLGSALASSVAVLYHRRPGATDSVQTTRNGAISSVLGASGAVMGFGAAAALAFPKTSMILLPIPIPMPLWLVTVGYVAIDLFFLDSGGFVAHAGHLGGFAYGALYYLAFLGRAGGLAKSLRRR